MKAGLAKKPTTKPKYASQMPKQDAYSMRFVMSVKKSIMIAYIRWTTMFKRHDCPHLAKGSSYWCKLKANRIINNTSLSIREKYTILHKSTCSGCEIYKEMKTK
jgi:hypothetical protein